jgi:hypothetical protein
MFGANVLPHFGKASTPDNRALDHDQIIVLALECLGFSAAPGLGVLVARPYWTKEFQAIHFGSGKI